MLRAILVFALVLGIVIGGLMLLRRTANMTARRMTASDG